MTKSQAKKIIRRAIELTKQVEDLKSIYRELDEIIGVMIEHKIKAGVDEGNVIRLVDNFTQKNTTFKSTAFRRYDLKLERAREVFSVRRSRRDSR